MTAKIANASKQLATDNVNAIKTAAILTAGEVVNTQLQKLAVAKAPFMLQGYLNSPLGKVVIANVAAVAIKQTRPDDDKAAALVEGMQVSAYQDLIKVFNINEFVDELLNSKDVKNALDQAK